MPLLGRKENKFIFGKTPKIGCENGSKSALGERTNKKPLTRTFKTEYPEV